MEFILKQFNHILSLSLSYLSWQASEFHLLPFFNILLTLVFGSLLLTTLV